MSAYTGKKVLITGGLGFIGSNLARRLLSCGAKLTLLDNLMPQYGGNPFNVEDIREKLTIDYGDLRNTHTIEPLLKDQDYLFNLAAQTSHVDSMHDPMTDLEINATAQLSLLEACRRLNPSITIVFASTRQVYGKPDYLPVDETHPLRPIDINGIHKRAAESYHQIYHTVHGLRTSVVRLTNTYGPGMRVKDARQNFLGFWIRRLLEGKPIPVFGDGLQLRDLTYVDDCVDALLLAGSIEQAKGKIYNLGSKELISLKDLAQTMTRMGFGGSLEQLPFPLERKRIDIGDFYSDFSLITADLGWMPKTSLEEGLRSTIHFYNTHRSHYWDDSNGSDHPIAITDDTVQRL